MKILFKLRNWRSFECDKVCIRTRERSTQNWMCWPTRNEKPARLDARTHHHDKSEWFRRTQNVRMNLFVRSDRCSSHGKCAVVVPVVAVAFAVRGESCGRQRFLRTVRQCGKLMSFGCSRSLVVSLVRVKKMCATPSKTYVFIPAKWNICFACHINDNAKRKTTTNCFQCVHVTANIYLVSHCTSHLIRRKWCGWRMHTTFGSFR